MRRIKSIVKLALHFPTIVAEHELDALQDQWKTLPSAMYLLRNAVHMPPTSFWYEIRSVKDGHGDMKFGLLSNFMCHLLVLPHSSACVERIFSQVNIVKTDLTNRLKSETVANRLLAKQAISRQSAACHSWQPSQALITDVEYGRCHQRYSEHLQANKALNSITVHDVDETDCV